MGFAVYRDGVSRFGLRQWRAMGSQAEVEAMRERGREIACGEQGRLKAELVFEDELGNWHVCLYWRRDEDGSGV